jgi:threonine dehydratase
MVEVEEQAQEIWGKGVHPDVVLCPIGGGGLASGAAIASKGYWGTDDVQVIGVEPAGKCRCAEVPTVTHPVFRL